MSTEQLYSEMQVISDRLNAEGATGVIVATLCINEGKRDIVLIINGALAVADATRLSGRIFDALLTTFPESSTPLPEVQQ